MLKEKCNTNKISKSANIETRIIFTKPKWNHVIILIIKYIRVALKSEIFHWNTISRNKSYTNCWMSLSEKGIISIQRETCEKSISFAAFLKTVHVHLQIKMSSHTLRCKRYLFITYVLKFSEKDFFIAFISTNCIADQCTLTWY